MPPAMLLSEVVGNAIHSRQAWPPIIYWLLHWVLRRCWSWWRLFPKQEVQEAGSSAAVALQQRAHAVVTKNNCLNQEYVKSRLTTKATTICQSARRWSRGRYGQVSGRGWWWLPPAQVAGCLSSAELMLAIVTAWIKLAQGCLVIYSSALLPRLNVQSMMLSPGFILYACRTVFQEHTIFTMVCWYQHVHNWAFCPTPTQSASYLLDFSI